MSEASGGWIDAKEKRPNQREYGASAASDVVEVILDNGEKDEDFLINGRWVFYCETNQTMPHIIAWREKL